VYIIKSIKRVIAHLTDKVKELIAKWVLPLSICLLASVDLG
jgi:hypothetical protein